MHFRIFQWNRLRPRAELGNFLFWRSNNTCFWFPSKKTNNRTNHEIFFDCYWNYWNVRFWKMWIMYPSHWIFSFYDLILPNHHHIFPFNISREEFQLKHQQKMNWNCAVRMSFFFLVFSFFSSRPIKQTEKDHFVPRHEISELWN